MDIDRDIQAFYAKGLEDERLTHGYSLELIRTQVLLERFLPAPPASVLDVGGASGVYASWLVDRGYDVTLVDPVRLHVEQATARGGFRAALGDARDLAEPDASYDAVLLLGPLYHLVARAERLRALREARRVVSPGGTVVVAAISRYASTLEGFFWGAVDEPGFAAMMQTNLTTGQHRNPTGDSHLFTTAYFHDRDGLAGEVQDAGLSLEAVVPVEGPLHWAPQISARLADPRQRRLILEVLTVLERDPAMTAATAHILAFAHAVDAQ